MNIMRLFHVLNRGVDKRTVFENTEDFVRFTRNLQLLNTSENVPHNDWSIKARLERDNSDKLVQIHAYCLMPNHYHLLLSEIQENGIQLYMKKINMGYTHYFNSKRKRVGTLWQGRYKSIEIENDAHHLYIPYYIHLNPLDLSMPQWRSGEVSNATQAVKILEGYKWSSYRHFLETSKWNDVLVSDSYLNTSLPQHSQHLKEIMRIISDPTAATHSEIIE